MRTVLEKGQAAAKAWLFSYECRGIKIDSLQIDQMRQAATEMVVLEAHIARAHAMADEARRALGFMTLAETAALSKRGIIVPDPGSTLVSPAVELGPDTVLWPGTILRITQGSLSVGPGVVIFPGTHIVAEVGAVTIEAKVEIGEEGGFTIKAEAGSIITVGDGARLLGGGSLTLSNRIGRGAQIIGPIRCQNCLLGDGATYRDPDPDLRGGVLKGSGVARGIEIPQGHVIQAFGLFTEGVMRQQSYFHPQRKS
jgi:carbonic anhydrase/acetyltransferase-like protein (isoleucine patch superfamily)